MSLFRLLIIIGINMLALYLTDRYVPGFQAPVENIKDLALVASILAVLNTVLKPLLDIILTPLRWVTFGASSLLISGAMVFILDNLSEKITINGSSALLLGTIIIGLTNTLCSQLLLHRSQ